MGKGKDNEKSTSLSKLYLNKLNLFDFNIKNIKKNLIFFFIIILLDDPYEICKNMGIYRTVES
jgi:hypothetical protein